MSFTVEQKIKGRIYLYKATSYWDKERETNWTKKGVLRPQR